jgi:hypothetical protein
MVYIACPYSLGDKQANLRESMRVWNALRREGYCPINPLWSHLQSTEFGAPESLTWEEWLEYDATIIARADAVLRLPGESRGADLECAWARAIGLPVFDEGHLWERADALDTWRDCTGRGPADYVG